MFYESIRTYWTLYVHHVEITSDLNVFRKIDHRKIDKKSATEFSSLRKNPVEGSIEMIFLVAVATAFGVLSNAPSSQ